MSKVKTPESSKEAFMTMGDELPTRIKNSVADGRLRIADYTLYSIKPIQSKTIKMFETQDDRETGMSNVSNAKIGKDQFMVVTGIYLLVGIAEDASNKEKLKATSFVSISEVPAIVNGDHSFKVNRRQIIPEDMSNRSYARDGDTSVPVGYWKLDNPRMIGEEELIEFTIELGTMEGIDSNTVLFVGLDGTITTP